LDIERPGNLGDVVYTFRYRRPLPDSVRQRAPSGAEWAIYPTKKSEYRFSAVPFSTISPTKGVTVVKIPDATPGMIERHAQSDEQALLAKLRYNRLLDIYSGITVYSLQSHLRTTISEGAQVETDEIYVGIDTHGRHFVLPVQAKGGRDTLSVVQIWQDFRMSQEKFPELICRPVAAQFMASNVIALFSFDWDGADGITVRPASERHYRLVPSAELTAADLEAYARLSAGSEADGLLL
jgi:hypothetical protein